MTGVELALAIEGAVGLVGIGGAFWIAGSKAGRMQERLDSIDIKLDNHIQHEFAEIRQSVKKISESLRFTQGKLSV